MFFEFLFYDIDFKGGCHGVPGVPPLAFSLKLTMCMTFGDIIPPDHPRHFYGFIYRITIGDKWYIGQKSFNRGEKWQTYKSSSKDVKELLKSNYGIFEILEYCKSVGELNYKESRWLFKTDALEDPNCLNKNIAGRYFRKTVSKY